MSEVAHFRFLDMGIGVNWPVPATSWTQNNFTNMCLNSCFELYGDPDVEHFPSSGSDVRLLCRFPIASASHLFEQSFPNTHPVDQRPVDKLSVFAVWLHAHPQYNLLVTKPASAKWPWLPGWGEDEGAGTTCATSKITVRRARVPRTLRCTGCLCEMT
jgi:hypothetical protein